MTKNVFASVVFLVFACSGLQSADNRAIWELVSESTKSEYSSGKIVTLSVIVNGNIRENFQMIRISINEDATLRTLKENIVTKVSRFCEQILIKV